jgi:cation transport ATPase
MAAGDKVRQKKPDRSNPPQSRGKKRLPGISKEVHQFLASVVLHLAMPLLPIAIEYIITRRIEESSMSLTASLYVVGIGLSSRNTTAFAFSLPCAILFAVVYGVVATKQNVAINATISLTTGNATVIFITCAVVIFFFFVTHVFERYTRHVVDGEIFLDLSGR